MKLPGVGRVIFWPGGSLWIGVPPIESERHVHHAIQLAMGLSDKVEFRADNQATWQAYAGAVIPSRLPHGFRAPGMRVANILFDPQSVAGRSAARRFPPEAITDIARTETTHWCERLDAAFRADADDEEMKRLAQQAVADICCTEVPERPTDPRILRAVDYIYSRLDEPLTLGEVAAKVHLSEGRLRHLFVAETGTGFRPFLLWARLNKAMELGFSDGNWTEAAYAASFADSAHLSRTCRSMFGFAPSNMRQRRHERSSIIPA